MFPTEVLRTRIFDEIRLRRLTLADGRDPSAPAPPALLWHERTVCGFGLDQLLISAPYLGRSFEPGVHAAISAWLRDCWVDRGHPGWKVTSVVAAFDLQAGRSGRLTLALTATKLDHDAERFDTPRAGRELYGVLARAERHRARALLEARLRALHQVPVVSQRRGTLAVDPEPRSQVE